MLLLQKHLHLQGMLNIDFYSIDWRVGKLIMSYIRLLWNVMFHTKHGNGMRRGWITDVSSSIWGRNSGKTRTGQVKTS